MAIGFSDKGYYTPSGQWVDPMDSVTAGIINGPGGGFGGMNPIDVYGINAGFMGNLANNNTSMANTAMQANASMQNAQTNALGNYYSTVYGKNTDFNIADLQNAGLNWRTAEGYKNALQLAGLNNESAQKIADMQFGAQRYGADQQLKAAGLAAGANQYGSLANLLGTLGSSQNQANASMYGSQAGLLGQLAGYDASRANTGVQTLGQLLQAKMQQQAQVAPTQLAALKFNRFAPLMESLLSGLIQRRNGGQALA